MTLHEKRKLARKIHAMRIKPARTPLGSKLMAIRQRMKANGERFFSADELEKDHV